MSEPTATDSGPKAAKPKRGRPPKTTRQASDRELIESLALTVAGLQKELAERNVQAAIPSIEVSDIKLPESKRPKSGTIIVVGHNPDGTEITRKVPFLRDELERENGPRVTFIPSHSVPMLVNRIRYDFVAGKPIDVPQGIKEEYERRMAAQHADVASRYPALTPQQEYEMKEQAKKSGGKPVWSPLTYLGVGLDATTPEGEAPATPVAQ